MSKRHSPKGSEGFTIIELLIATTVFAVVLLVALVSFLEIGNLFYKGVSTSNTQAVANQILQDISGQFQTSGSFSSVPTTQVMPSDSQTSYSYYCIGNTRYTYTINHELDITAASNFAPLGQGGNFALLKDQLPGNTGCAAPCNTAPLSSCAAGTYPFTNPVEMLGNKMRLSEFEIQPAATGSAFYTVSIVVAYGPDDAFNNLTDPTAVACNGNEGIDQFCDVSRLNTSVFKGLDL